MGATLAQRSGRAGPEIRVSRARPRGRAQSEGTRASLRTEVEKFVIEGGTRLSGTIVPAGNKNGALPIRSEEHTSELQSRSDLVCRLLLENNKKRHRPHLRLDT